MLKLLDQAQEPSEGEMFTVTQGKKNYLLGKFEGKVYVVDGKCTHLGCRLGDGKLEGAIITCPCHGSRFDLRSGEVVKWIGNWPKTLVNVTEKIGLARGLKAYPAIQKEDGIYIELR